MKIVKCIILLFIANSVSSQTIINAERFAGGTDSTIFALNFSYNGTRGNSNTDQFNIAPYVTLIRKKNDYMLFGGYSLLSRSNDRILNAGFIHLRHNYKITERFKSFEFYQLQFNEILLLTKREVFGAGLRYSFLIRDSLNFDLGVGIMRELEILNRKTLQPDELSETTYYRATCVSTLNWVAAKTIMINNVMYYQPYLKDFSDYRLLNDLKLIFTVSQHFKLITSVTARYDSKPPAILKNLDTAVNLGFELKF